MELGNLLIFLFPRKLRYLKCFKELIKLGKASNLENFKSSSRKYLNLEMHVSTNNLLILIKSCSSCTPSLHEKIIYCKLLLSLFEKGPTTSTPKLWSKIYTCLAFSKLLVPLIFSIKQ